MQTLVETGTLVGAPGAYRLAHAQPTIQVPATVQAVLAARIDRLPPEDKRLLQTAAVIGTEVPCALRPWRSCPQKPCAGPHASPGRRVPVRDEPVPGARSTPSSTPSRRRWPTAACCTSGGGSLHAHIVEALEALPGTGPRTGRTPRLPCLTGEGWDKALAYCRQAGRRP